MRRFLKTRNSDQQKNYHKYVSQCSARMRILHNVNCMIKT